MKRFCEYCGQKSYKLEDHNNHMTNCDEKPKPKPKPKPKKSKLLCEEVTDKVRCLDDIPRLVSEVMLREGYEVIFNEIPNNWSDNPYRSPYGVRFPNSENIYAGWKGRWEGTITPIKKGKEKIGISDLHSVWDEHYDFQFIRTESGSCGENFNIGGHILVDDFPHLHREYLVQGFTERYDNEMKEKVSAVAKHYNKLENDKVKGNTALNEVKFEIKQVQQILSVLNNIESEQTTNIREQFRGETKIDLPDIECPFINMKAYLELKDDFKDKKVIVDDEATLEAVNELANVIKSANKFANERLESFI